jgi:hypothetical protein
MFKEHNLVDKEQKQHLTSRKHKRDIDRRTLLEKKKFVLKDRNNRDYKSFANLNNRDRRDESSKKRARSPQRDLSQERVDLLMSLLKSKIGEPEIDETVNTQDYRDHKKKIGILRRPESKKQLRSEMRSGNKFDKMVNDVEDRLKVMLKGDLFRIGDIGLKKIRNVAERSKKVV